MEGNGFRVKVEDVQDLSPIKTSHGIPANLWSCHTAIVDGYVIEGHVSVAEIERLMAERPTITGLAVPGMPIGSPGMESEGAAPQPYDVIMFDESGVLGIYASYN